MEQATEYGAWKHYPPEEDAGEHTVVGTVLMLEALHSPQLDNQRDIYVYLPPSYRDTDRRYPVIYMHDGQNLFDRATAFGEEWRVDNTLEEGAEEGMEAIVVGIPNLGSERLNEYSPWMDPGHQQGGRGDAYVDFLVRTLKPIVDRDFRTLPECEHTGIAGSSMGGLISLYAFFRNPDVFGFAGVMSPALWFAERKIFPFVEEAPFPGGKVYVDVGTQEGAEELTDVRRLCEILLAKGYQKKKDFLYVVEMGGAHNEAAWARRLNRELHFLLGVPLHLQKQRRAG